ncbi:MAG TPA: hypothetical protein VNJ54_06010 [Plantibacter sp.]|uniref:hypothetical protein n=1 Tax=unclassified Plantibacter TaxID=2624265 RepID=UPI002B7D381B|nr:hypothetical protein [Plantibacter sp.]
MDDRGLLELIYRSRPRTVAELASVAHLDESEVLAHVSRLEAQGALSVRDGAVTYPHPASWTANIVATRTRELRESSATTTTQIEALVADLPSLLRHWSVGEAPDDLAPVFARHGPRAAEDLWYDTAQDATASAWAVLPTVERFLTSDPDRAARFSEAFAGKQSVRALLPASVLSDERLVALSERYAASGVEFRVLDELPSWFWIDGDLLALPFEWGEDWPTSVLGVRNASLAALGRTLFEQLWSRSRSIGFAGRAWTPLMQLMRKGITLDSASRTLGINPRTGRRRVAAAMEHYGVSTLFALGVAWAADADQAD